MGQKLNPTIFRLGVNSTWKTGFFEKKSSELPLYIFKDIEIRNYIERVFEMNGLIMHDYQQHYNTSTLNLYVSYFVTSEFLLNKKKGNETIIIKNSEGNRKILNKVVTSNNYFYSILKNKPYLISNDSLKLYEIKQYLTLNSHSQLLTKASFVSFQELQKNKYLQSRSASAKNVKLVTVFNEIHNVLNSYLTNNRQIVVNFCCINKNVQFLKPVQTFVSFQKYRNTPLFKEGIELLFNTVYNGSSANLLAKFIAFQLKKVKRHKFLLAFIKQTLTILLTSNLAKIKGVKILVKGRLNGVPRAKHKTIIIGDVPVQTIAAKLDYSQTAIHNSNGSYGIKVWVLEKS